MLMVWDLRPNVDIPSAPRSPSPPSCAPSDDDGQSGPTNNFRPQPTAYVISFPHALSSVCAHATTTKDLLVADVRGSLALIDWRTDPSHASTVRVIPKPSSRYSMDQLTDTRITEQPRTLRIQRKRKGPHQGSGTPHGTWRHGPR